MALRTSLTLVVIIWSFLDLGSICQAQLSSSKPQADRASEGSAEEDRDRAIMGRFVTLLEKNPRRGTAVDRIYGYHVERGTLDAFLKTYRERVAKDPNEGAAWLILGIFESQRGQDAKAVAALREAESKRPSDAIPCYYLGQALVLVGQPEAATNAFERALTRKPTRADMLEIYQALGRSYQRTRQNGKALEVWNRLEAQFPNDVRVKEQVADALAEESQSAEALSRYEALAKAVKDKYRQVRFQMEAAELKVKLGKRAQALDDFEQMLGQLNPDSWLYREVRRKIEEVFLRNDDLAGLVAYYERWIKKTPDDVEALSRLAKTLANQGRTADARSWFEKAVKLAPSKQELRQALIDQLVQDGKFVDAAAQYEEIHKTDPKNFDVVRDWGQMLLKDETKPDVARKTAATAVWRTLVDGPAPDPLVVSRVADLFRQSEMPEDAIALYKKAIELAPEATQYREYLGEFLHTLKRSDEAKAVWGEIAVGSRHNAKNLTRLGEVLSGFGYRKEAIDAFAEACKLDDDEYDLRIKYADVLFQGERFADAIAQLDMADKLVSDPDQAEAVLVRRIKAYQEGNTLAAQVDSLRKELEAGKDVTASRWVRLARYLEADQKPTEASQAVRKGIELDPKSIPSWVAAARIFEMSGDLGAAAQALRDLAAIDRRGRSEYFASLAKLEGRLGRRQAAMEAGRELLAASPGNPETYQDYAELCFQLGEVEEGLDALRRSVRANPSDPKVALALAEALARQFRTDEAIELFWRAFEKAPDLDAKLNTVSRLTDLYLQRNQFDRLIARLERLLNEPDKQREMTLCLAQAHVSSGDLGTARQELERLLATNARDTQLLQQLSSLSETEGDLTSAVKYQKQLVEIAPTDEASLRLATLHLQAGESAEAEAIWSRLAGVDKDSAHALQAVDSLLGTGKREAALVLTDRLIRRKPDDWEALYREGVALLGLNRGEEAARRFRAILDLRTNDDDIGALVKRRMKNTSSRPTGAISTAAARAQGGFRMIPWQDRVNAAYQIRIAIGLERQISVLNRQNYTWSPYDFGQARMAALAGLYFQADKAKSREPFLKDYRAARDKSLSDPRPAWNWYFLQLVLLDQTEAYEAAKSLARQFPNDPSALWVYLYSLSGRVAGTTGPRRSVINMSTENDTTPPLVSDELDKVVSAYQGLRRRRPDWIQGTVLTSVIAELKRAKRTEEENRIYREALDSVNDAAGVATLLLVAGERGDIDGVIALSDKSERLQTGGGGLVNYYYNPSGNAYSMIRGMIVRAQAKGYADIPKLIDYHLQSLRRQRQSGRKSSTVSRISNSGQVVRNVVIYAPGGRARALSIDYPAANAYFDQAGIQMLRNAYEIYKRDDIISDFVTHFRNRTKEDIPKPDRLDALLILSALDWWENDKEAAIDALQKALALSGGDAELALSLAELHEKQGERDEAMAVIDGIEALDNTVLQRRELASLRLSVATGNLERARLACDRLFGLRLDTATQTMLAGQMHQLGMHEQAESVLMRARHRAGQQVSTLVALMSEYQRQDKPDQAAQIANQILRRSGGRRILPPGYYNEDELARDEAIRLLGRSGKLRESIARLEAQAERSPKSLQIQQALADYYRAANDRVKIRETYERIAKIKPDDGGLRFHIASQIAAGGDSAAAIEHYRAALALEPSLLANNGFQTVMTAFRQAKKMDQFANILESIDIKMLGHPAYVGQLIQELGNDPKLKEQGRKLTTRAWEAFPDQRLDLLLYMDRDEGWWNQPEAYELSLQAMIPTPALAASNPWSGINTISMYMGDGRVVSLVSRLLFAAKQQNKTEDLARRLEEAIKERPQWKGGRALLAVIQARGNRFDEARANLKELLDGQNKGTQSQVCWVIAQELEDIKPLEDVAVKLYEREVHDVFSSGNMNGSFRYNSPIIRLITVYRRGGHKAEAREWLRKLATNKADFSNYAPQAIASQKANELNELASQMLSLDAVADAVKLYGELLEVAGTIPHDAPYYPNRETALRQAQNGLEQALKNVKPELLGECLASLLESRTNAKPGEPLLNLMPIVQPRELDRATVFSITERLITAMVARPETREQVQTTLANLAERAPQDLSVQIGLALAAIAAGTPEAIDRATKNLAELLDRVPLEPLPQGSRANARQREEAAKQTGLWLVARACWKVESQRNRGELFANRAIEAARRHTDSLLMLAMLREWGQHSLDQGDRNGAEAQWAKMLELILPKPDPSKSSRKGAKSSENPPPGAPAHIRTNAQVKEIGQPVVPSRPLATAVAQVGAGGRPQLLGGDTPAPTTEKFEQVAQLAKLAAEHGMADFSLRALRESLRNGPPVNPISPDAGAAASRAFVTGSTDSEPKNATGRIIEEQFATLLPLWKRQGASDVQIYELLRDVVLPEARSKEVFPYLASFTRSGRGLNGQSGTPESRSVAQFLVQAAVDAKRVDDLARVAEARRDQALAEPGVTVLLALLAIGSNDDTKAGKALDSLTSRLQKDTLQNSAELACHAAVLALDRPALTKQAEALLELAVKNLAIQNSAEPRNSLQRLLAHHWFARKEMDKGKKILEQALSASESSLGVGRSNVEYTLSRRKGILADFTAEYVRVGQLDAALELMGRYCDIPAGRYGYEAERTIPAAILVSQLSALPPAERYQKLKNWVMPTASRTSVRQMGEFLSDEPIPSVFKPKSVPPTSSSDVMSIAGLLIDAARSVGKLDELDGELKKAVDKKQEGAMTLWFLTRIARGQGASVSEEMTRFADEIHAKVPEPSPGSPMSIRYNDLPSFDWSEFLLARACLADPGLSTLGERMANDLVSLAEVNYQARAFAQRLPFDLAASRWMRACGTEVKMSVDPGLAHLWLGYPGRVPHEGWIFHEGRLASIGRSSPSFGLAFPLLGSFAFSVDVFFDEKNSFALNYGPVHMNVNGKGMGAARGSQAESHAALKSSFVRPNAYNRVTLAVDDDRKIRIWVNGHLYHEGHKQSAIVPWLFFGGSGHLLMRNPTITGKAEVPRTVALIDGDQNDGWNAQTFGETLAPAPKTDISLLGTIVAPLGTSDFDWSIHDGVIKGRKLEISSANHKIAQSHFAYGRPLQDKDSLRYQFYYEPGQFAVHPTLGGIAFLLDPAGVREHWMTSGANTDETGIEPGNVADEPDHRRGSAPLPLKPKEWNAVKLTFAGGKLAISLNDVLIYERPVESSNPRNFGFYHEKNQTEAKVKDVVLEGDWPKVVPNNLLEIRGGESSSSLRLARHAVIGEADLVLDVDEVLRRTRSLPPAERYKALSDWVLPGDDHPTFRLQMDFAPTDPAPPVAAEFSQRGTLVAPALELVALAKELSKLPELAQQVEGLKAGTDLDKRGKIALEALILAAQGKDAEADAALKKLLPSAKVSGDSPEWMRGPELVALAGMPASIRQGTTAGSLLEILTHAPLKKDASVPRWLRHAIYEQALIQSQIAGGAAELAGWTPVSPGRAETRGGGEPRPRWTFAKDQWSRLPGDGDDSLVFSTPLGAPFFVDAEIRSWDRGQTRLTYGGFRLGLDPEGMHLKLSLAGEPLRDVKLAAAPQGKEGWRKVHLEARDSLLIISVDGTKVHEQALAGTSDPWLTITAEAGGAAAVRNVKVTGSPRIPDAISLTDTLNLAGWSAAYYGEPTNRTNAAWEKRGDELTGVRLKPPVVNQDVYYNNGIRSDENAEKTALPGSRWESLLRYPRPIAEKGSIEYEFFDEPGKTMVHPALGRLVFLIGPKGVNLHWLTDAQYERTGLLPGNETSEPGNRRGPDPLPLKAGDWNRLKLTLEGNKVSLLLNETLVYERDLEPDNSRLFGFFHFADETDCRIRNVTLRGDWPKSFVESAKAGFLLPELFFPSIPLVAGLPANR